MLINSLHPALCVKRPSCLFFFRLLLLLCVPLSLAAQEVVVSGSAPVVGGDLALARWQATNNALRAAAEGGVVELRSGAVMNEGVVQEALTMRSMLRSEAVRILEERIERGVMTVRLQARLRAADAPAVCTSPYRKRVLVTGMPLLRPEQLGMGEMQGYARGTAQGFARHLEGSGRFAVALESGTFIYTSPPAAPQLFAETGKVAMDRQRAQYLLSGVIRNLALERSGRSLLSEEKLQRQIEIELFLHDRLTGEAVARRSFTRHAAGNVRLPSRVQFGSEEFLASPLGEAFSSIFEEAGTWVAGEIACRPFHARITAVHGKQLEIDAGGNAGLRSGDLLIVLAGGVGGAPRPIASARIDQVSAEASIAEVPAGSGRAPAPGDLVMSW